MDVFKRKLENLKMMQEAEILTDEEFLAEKNELLDML